MSLEFIKVPGGELEVEFEYYRERDGLRETGTNLLLTPPEPEFVDIIKVSYNNIDITDKLSEVWYKGIVQYILNLAHNRTP